MQSQPDILDASSARPVAIRMRPDLVVEAQTYGADRYWLVKDPVALAYYHLREEEHAILRMLDGRTSLDQIKRRFEEAFAPLQLTFGQIQAFLGRLHKLGLVVSEHPGQGRELLERRVRRRRSRWLQAASNLLAIRTPGVDPEPLLVWLYPKTRWLFSRWFLAVCAVLVAAAATLVAVELDTVVSRLPRFGDFFTVHNLFWLAVVLAAVKVVHELGHALTCKHFGGECHEIGLLLLVFTPCLYCNVSDAWLLAGKWPRIAISAAGIVVELVLASLAALGWWFSHPGLFNTLCLSLVFVCSVSTLLLNGNPLLRYDGYYILADLADVPNLGQQSRALVGRWLAKFCLGAELPPDRSMPSRRHGFLAVYGAASTAYRWLVVLAILWFCYRVLEPHGMGVIAQGLTGAVVAGLVLMPAWGLAVFLRNPDNRSRVRRGRAATVSILFVAAVVLLLFVPLPFRVTAPAVLQPEDLRSVYVVVPGRLETAVEPGKAVAGDEPLATLVNLDLAREIADLEGRRDRQRLRLENLRRRMGDDPAAAAEIPSAREALADLDERLAERRQDHERLVLRAPIAGTVLPPPRVPTPPYEPDDLAAWHGSPLERENLGSTLQTGTLLCQVGDLTTLEAMVVLSQADVTFVRPGQRVRVKLDGLPGEILGGTVTEVAYTALEEVPRELAAGGELAVRRDDRGVARPSETSYEARVRLDEHDAPLLAGARGRVKILAAPQSLGRRLLRQVRRTFRFSP